MKIFALYSSDILSV